MYKKKLIVFLMLLPSLITFSQETNYFNNVYNNENGITTGLSIIETNDGYIGYGVTINTGMNGQKLVFIKINFSGEELIWKLYGNDYQAYYPGNVGGALIKTNDEEFALAYHTDYGGIVYSSLIKFDNNLDTLWKKDYTTNNLWTMTMNTLETNDYGFLLTGSVKPAEGEYWNFLTIKTDSIGIMEWYQTYGGNLSEHGTNTIETPDGGYLLGGFRWNPPVDQSMDAMVIKTDSLGNEQWTKYYGNPNVDDDMALVAMADDGNYLVATVYGDEVIAPEARIGKIYLIKSDSSGNAIYENKIGPSRLNIYIKNLRKLSDGYLISGFSKETDTATYQYYSGWIMKIDNNFDSVWYRDYIHQDEDWESLFYDASPTTDNGYIAIGKARPDIGNNKMWIVKVDSMGCDTPGCATGTFIKELPLPAGTAGELRIWPNPAEGEFKVMPYAPPLVPPEGGKPSLLTVYNSQGIKVKEINIPATEKITTVNVRDWQRGIYYVRMTRGGKNFGSGKVVVR